MTTSRRLWPPVLALAALLAGAQAARSEASPPQGEDPPGAEDGTPPRAPHDGVIVPPEIGDEEIETGVPDPDAGHDEEVIPPPDMRDAGPDAAPR
jgi:hypothetical protein